MPINDKNRSSFGFFGEISKEVLTNYTYKYTLKLEYPFSFAVAI